MKRNRIPMSDRDIAGHILMGLARHEQDGFCLNWFYDYDIEFLSDLSKSMSLPPSFPTDSLLNRLRKVCRHMEACGLLCGRVASCHKEYIGEPTVLKKYRLGNGSWAMRLAPEKYPHYKPMGRAETELDLLLDHAYPEERSYART